jgi:hypothetical protein
MLLEIKRRGGSWLTSDIERLWNWKHALSVGSRKLDEAPSPNSSLTVTGSSGNAFRSRIRDEPDLQRPFYAGLFNKAVLEFMCKKPYKETLQEIVHLETPNTAATCDLLKMARKVLDDPPPG